MSTRIIHEKQDLKYLQWSQIRSSSGTAGSFLKATDDLQKPKKYYKLSNYDGINGIIGHECVNELITDRLLNILGIEHLHYDLIHAEITVNDKNIDTYLCMSEDFKKIGENKAALDTFYEAEHLAHETPMEFCIRNGWEKFDIMQDRPVQCFVGSYYAQQNLQLIPREKMPQLHPLQEKHKAILLEGLDGIIPRYLQEKIWNMIWKRWLYYENFCNQK